MNIPHHKYTLFLALQHLFLLIWLLMGCTGKLIPAALPGTTSSGNQQQLLFITLEALKDTVTGSIEIKIVQQQLAKGSLNEGTVTNTPLQAGNWKISLLNKKDQTVSYLVIPNPMIRELEYADEDGRFKRKTVLLSRAEIPLRFNYNTSIKKIKAEELISNQSVKTLYRSALSL